MFKMQTGFIIVVSMIAIPFLSSCGDSNVETVEKGQTSKSAPAQAQSKPESAPAESTPSNSAAGTTASAAGVTWTIPEGWDLVGPRPMRAATYMIGKGELESECGVFFFGNGQGGDIETNINRWIGQFQQPDGSDSKSKAKVGHRDVNGLKVTTIDLAGTFMSGGMGGQPQVSKLGFRLLGAIVEAPDGPLFFKLTGPIASVDDIQPDFEYLIGALKKS